MKSPMTKDRLAEIRKEAATWRSEYDPDDADDWMSHSAIGHRAELLAELDQAREVARKLRSYLDIWVDATLIPGLERDLIQRLGLDALPDWLTGEPETAGDAEGGASA